MLRRTDAGPPRCRPVPRRRWPLYALLGAVVAGAGTSASAPVGAVGGYPAVAPAGEAPSGEYWTDERMRRAPLDSGIARAARSDARRTAAPSSRTAPVRRAVPWTPAGPPARAVGRVFFTVRGSDYSCTGTAVRSANRDTVITAGHCVDSGPGPYATGWVFVPGYAGGRRPYGTWTARRLYVSNGWLARGALPEDVGFAVVAPLHGRHLADVVGGLPVAFAAPRGADVRVLGYPVDGPDSGRRPMLCRGTAHPDPYGTGAQGVACTMTAGVSGGPWLSGSDPAAVVYAVTSFTYRGMDGTVWAPYLDSSAAALYARAQTG